MRLGRRQRPRLAALNPAKARRFEAFAPASETLRTEWTAWWRTQSQSNQSPLPNSLLDLTDFLYQRG
jgi:hypothetical protein